MSIQEQFRIGQGVGATMDLTPFQEGVIAAKSGDGTALNPYLLGTDTHDAWLKGHAAVESALQSENIIEQNASTFG